MSNKQIMIVGDSVSGSRGHLHTLGRAVTSLEYQWITGQDVPRPKTIKTVGRFEYEGLPLSVAAQQSKGEAP